MLGEIPAFIKMDVTQPDIRELPDGRNRLRPEITPLGLEGYFNSAVIDRRGGRVTLLARQAEKPSEYGQPDVGQLVQIDLAPDGLGYKLLGKNTIWSPEDTPGRLLEDVRAFQSKDPNDRRIFLGATVVMNNIVNGKDEPTPYGAIAILDDESQIPDVPTKFRPCPELGPGKNMTPIDNEGTFLFRKEGNENNHKLTIFHYDKDSDTVTETGELDFRPYMGNASWGSFRIGTTGAPIEEGNTIILPIHGIDTDIVSLEQNPYGQFFRYKLGIAILGRSADGKLFVNAVDSEPMLEPSDFTKDGERMGRQLHPELRDAVYLCGYRTRGEGSTRRLDTFTSYGDTQTFQASFDMNALAQRVEMLEEREATALAA